MVYAGLIAAAGRSSRMGAFKPLLPFGGSTILEHSVQSLLDGGAERVTVVLGQNSDTLRRLLRRFGRRVSAVENPAYAETDMLRSVQLGLAEVAAREEVDAVFFLPGDMPAVKASTLRRCIGRYETHGCDLVYPMYGERRGHPPLIGRLCFDGVLGFSGEGGLRAALAGFEARAIDFDAKDRGCVLGANTEAEYQALLDYAKARRLP